MPGVLPHSHVQSSISKPAVLLSGKSDLRQLLLGCSRCSPRSLGPLPGQLPTLCSLPALRASCLPSQASERVPQPCAHWGGIHSSEPCPEGLLPYSCHLSLSRGPDMPRKGSLPVCCAVFLEHSPPTCFPLLPLSHLLRAPSELQSLSLSSPCNSPWPLQLLAGTQVHTGLSTFICFPCWSISSLQPGTSVCFVQHCVSGLESGPGVGRHSLSICWVNTCGGGSI